MFNIYDKMMFNKIYITKHNMIIRIIKQLDSVDNRFSRNRMPNIPFVACTSMNELLLSTCLLVDYYYYLFRSTDLTT
jgi:hypothetical protein